MLDLMDKSLLATFDYVYNSIDSERNKRYYKATFDEILRELDSVETLADASRKLAQLEDSTNWDKKYPMFSMGNPKKYDLLAIAHAQDVVKSLRTRFETGGKSQYTKFGRN